jgi:signal peptidase
MKQKIYKVIDGISVLIIVCAVLVLLKVVLTGSGEAPSVFGYSVFRVMTGSMEPELETGSLIVVRKIEPAALKEGDIISFYSRDASLDGAVNTHRIVAIQENDGGYSFTTRGDANNVDDRYPVAEEDLIGKVIYSSVGLGKLVRLLSNPLIFIPVICLPLGIMMITNLVHTISLAKQIAKEEEEKAVREAIEELKKKREAGK